MTKEERREYMKQYRADHKDQIKASVERRNMEKFKNDFDHIVKVGNVMRCFMKDGMTFDFIRPFG